MYFVSNDKNKAVQSINVTCASIEIRVGVKQDSQGTVPLQWQQIKQDL